MHCTCTAHEHALHMLMHCMNAVHRFESMALRIPSAVFPTPLRKCHCAMTLLSPKVRMYYLNNPSLLPCLSPTHSLCAT